MGNLGKRDVMEWDNIIMWRWIKTGKIRKKEWDNQVEIDQNGKIQEKGQDMTEWNNIMIWTLNGLKLKNQGKGTGQDGIRQYYHVEKD